MTVEATIERFILDELLLGSGPQTLDPDENLLESNILDSLSLMRIVIFLEEQFGTPVDDGELVPENFQTVNRIKSLVTNKQPV